MKVINCFENGTINKNDLPDSWQNNLMSSYSDFMKFLQTNWESKYSIFYKDEEPKNQQIVKISNNLNLKVGCYIGTVIFRDLKINIYPKSFKTKEDDQDFSKLNEKYLLTNLCGWLNIIDNQNPSILNIKNSTDKLNDLRELLIYIYVHFTKKVLEKKLFYRYEEITEDLHLIRGRINFTDYCLNKYVNGKQNQFECTYSSFEFDNKLNQIIKCVMHLIYKYASENTKHDISIVLNYLNDVSEVNCNPYDCDQIKLSYFQSEYIDILNMSRMFLMNEGPAFENSNSSSFCLLFRSYGLYERFMFNFIKNTFGGTANVTRKADIKYIFDHVDYDSKSIKDIAEMRLDIFVKFKGSDKKIILDTKYKMISRFDETNIEKVFNKNISVGDIHQMITYGRTMGIHDIYLLYPLYRFETPETVFPKAVNYAPARLLNDDINVHIIRVPFNFENDYAADLTVLTNFVKTHIK